MVLGREEGMRRKIFGEGKYLVLGGDEQGAGKGGKCLEKENFWSR